MTYDLAKDSPIDRDKIRERYRKTTDEELQKDGQAAAFMSSSQANFGMPPREVFVVRLEEARAEWRRRMKLRAEKSKMSEST